MPFLRGGTCEDAAETPARLSGEVGARASESNYERSLAVNFARSRYEDKRESDGPCSRDEPAMP